MREEGSGERRREAMKEDRGEALDLPIGRRITLVSGEEWSLASIPPPRRDRALPLSHPLIRIKLSQRRSIHIMRVLHLIRCARRA
jgi:hypothetical protein